MKQYENNSGYPITHLIDFKSKNYAEGKIVCPVCGFDYHHPTQPITIGSNDNYRAGWWGRGDLTIIPFWGECGHIWELCVGFHKGYSYLFLRTEDSISQEGLASIKEDMGEKEFLQWRKQ